MGGSRMGFDLRTKIGRQNLRTTYQYKAYKRDWSMILGDTLLSLVCAVLGHERYDANNQNGCYGPPEWACKRCHHYIP